MSEFKDAALRYHALGLHPIPVEPRGKRPLLPSWREYCQRQPTIEEIESWWAATPDANVALIMGRGMIAIDVDGPEGEAALALEGITLPMTAPTATTGKGRHVFFKADACPNSVGILPKVDTRGDGGYVVAPPSIHPNGARYTWITSLDGDTEPLPERLREILSRPQRPTADQRGDADWLTAALAGVGEGGRDTACTRLAGYFLGKGVPAQATEVLLLAWADRCTPPFPADQVSKCVASIAKREGDPDALPDPPLDIVEVMDRTFKLIEHPPRAAETSLPTLDEILAGGFQAGELVYLGARPSIGKTALALQIARSVAGAGKPVLFITREMGPPALGRRLIAQEALVKLRNLKTGQLAPEERSRAATARARLNQLPLKITAKAISVSQIEQTVAEAGQLGLVVVDYLQLIRAPMEIRDRRASIDHVSLELKGIATKYDVPVLCLSQLTRPPRDAGKNWRPNLSDLRESGSLEADADTVLLLHWDRESTTRELNVGKQRDGELGVITLTFAGEYQLFQEAK